jgi:putative transposase
MARSLRIEFAGAVYHVMSRGDRREAIFRDDADRELFLKTLGETCEKTGWLIHAYCLMTNHFHLLVETQQGNLVVGMKWFLGIYTQRFNRRYRQVGHLFSGRYKAPIVSEKGEYFLVVADYIHLNPMRAGLVQKGQPLTDYPRSSFPTYVSQREVNRPAWLVVERLLLATGVGDSPRGRLALRERTEALRGQSLEHEAMLRRGWLIGSEEERHLLKKRLEQKVTPSRERELRMEAAEQRAEAIVAERLGALGWTEKDLSLIPKGDKHKVELALCLKQATTVTTAWIAHRLQMGTSQHLSHLLWKISK